MSQHYQISVMDSLNSFAKKLEHYREKGSHEAGIHFLSVWNLLGVLRTTPNNGQDSLCEAWFDQDIKLWRVCPDPASKVLIANRERAIALTGVVIHGLGKDQYCTTFDYWNPRVMQNGYYWCSELIPRYEGFMGSVLNFAYRRVPTEFLPGATEVAFDLKKLDFTSNPETAPRRL